jgi:hypothetical protein
MHALHQDLRGGQTGSQQGPHSAGGGCLLRRRPLGLRLAPYARGPPALLPPAAPAAGTTAAAGGAAVAAAAGGERGRGRPPTRPVCGSGASVSPTGLSSSTMYSAKLKLYSPGNCM